MKYIKLTIFLFICIAILVVQPLTASAETPTTLASYLSYPYRIAVDSTSVYWAEADYNSNIFDGTIKKVGINGGTVTTLASSLPGWSSHPYDIAVDSTNVYWTDANIGVVMKVGINGGTVTEIASANGPVGIAIDSTNVYWTEPENGAVKKVSKNGGTLTVTTLASGLSKPYGIAVDSTDVYFIGYGDGTVNKVSINGGTVTTLVSGLKSNMPRFIAIDSTNVYWTESNIAGTVKKVSKSGEIVTTLASGLNYPGRIKVDSTTVYWTESHTAGAVKKVSKNGGTTVVLASGLSVPYDIAIDSTNVYWVEHNSSGTVKKVSISTATTTATPAGGNYTSAQSVTLTCDDGTGSGCGNIYYTTDGTTPTTSSTVYSTPISISATTTLKFFAQDLAGNSEVVKTEIYTIIDTTSPTGSISINSGATYTNSTSVTLSISASDSSGVSQMCISNSTSCSSWETYTTSKSWMLTSGDGTKTVYVWFKDSVGNANTSPYSDTITLDATGPTDGTLSASPGNGQILLSWSGFSDATSGISSYKLVYSTSSVPSSCSTGTEIYSGPNTSYTHTGLVNGTNYHYRLCGIDNAGNSSTGKTAVAKPEASDTTPPTDGTLTATADNTTVVLSWSNFSDAGSGIASYKLVYTTGSAPASCSIGTQLYSGSGAAYTHTGLSNGTTYYYRICATDNAGNSSTGAASSAIPVAPDGASIPPSDTGITGVEREDGGSDNNNIDSTTNKPRIDITYNFGIVIKDPTGSQPQYTRLYITDRSNPSTSDFYYVDLVCDSNWAYGATCNYATLLGPAANHKYYFEAKLADGSILRYPSTGEIAGPVVELLTGYNMVSIPRDTNGANMDGSTAFGNTQTYKWVSDGITTDSNKGSYVLVDSNNPVNPGEGYFTMKGDGITTLPEHGAYNDALSPTYEITLNPGWNIISSPYGGNVKLSNVQVQKGSVSPESWGIATANGWVVNAIYYYKGSDWGSAYTFESAGGNPDAILVPWFGYWVYLNKNDDTYKLVITRP